MNAKFAVKIAYIYILEKLYLRYCA